MTQCVTRTGSYWWVQRDSMCDKDGELPVGSTIVLEMCDMLVL